MWALNSNPLSPLWRLVAEGLPPQAASADGTTPGAYFGDIPGSTVSYSFSDAKLARTLRTSLLVRSIILAVCTVPPTTHPSHRIAWWWWYSVTQMLIVPFGVCAKLVLFPAAQASCFHSGDLFLCWEALLIYSLYGVWCALWQMNWHRWVGTFHPSLLAYSRCSRDEMLDNVVPRSAVTLPALGFSSLAGAYLIAIQMRHPTGLSDPSFIRYLTCEYVPYLNHPCSDGMTR